MIYQAYVDHFSKVLSKSDPPDMFQVQKDRRISPANQHPHVSASVNLKSIPNKGQLEMVTGVIQLQDMSLFEKDRNGLTYLKEYVLKLIDNYYQYASQSGKNRREMVVMARIATRRRMVGQLNRVMPEYVKKLSEDEKILIKSLNIGKDVIDTVASIKKSEN